MKKILLALLIITLLLVGCGRGSSEDSITIGGKNLPSR